MQNLQFQFSYGRVEHKSSYQGMKSIHENDNDDDIYV